VEIGRLYDLNGLEIFEYQNSKNRPVYGEQEDITEWNSNQ
jgi:hypothetical protein